jgi:predicted amidohydrolase YtcJ
MKDFLLLAVLGSALLGAACQSPSPREVANLILLNGVVYTMDPALPWAEAVGVKDGRILAVGSSVEIQALAGEETEVVELKGAMVLPGFIDAHTHFLNGGFSLADIQLRDADSREEFIARIRARVDQIEKGDWILNGDWDHTLFDPPQLPAREWIDGFTRDTPVCVNRLDGHMVFANSRALELAGITKDTPTPLGGEIVKDSVTGELTGILKDEAMGLVTRHIHEPSLSEKLSAARAALAHAASMGVTSVHDMAYRDNFHVYQELLKEGGLTARLCVYIPIAEIDGAPPLELGDSPDRDWLKIGGLKGFVDGSLGSFTALFLEPYTDDPRKSGIQVADMYPEGIMEQRIRKADRQGLQVAIHAIGDKANRIILDIFEKVVRENGERDRRWRIEHAQHLHPEDITRFSRLGILASVQPYHAIDDGRWAETKIGPRRARTTYAFRSLLEGGASLVCGSDWTVAPLDPLAGIYAAVTRRTLDGVHPQGWVPQEKISLEEAIKGYTLNGAYSEFAEDRKGSITPGKLADLVVINRNLFEIPVEDINQVRVKMTVSGGRIVYQR